VLAVWRNNKNKKQKQTQKKGSICTGNAPLSSGRENWRILQLNRSEIGTTNALQCQFPVWRDHAIGPRTARNGGNYCTALKRNMGRSAHGNLVQWVNLQNRRRAGSSYSHYTCCVFSPTVAGCGSRSYTDKTSNWPVLYQILQFFQFPVFPATNYFEISSPYSKGHEQD